MLFLFNLTIYNFLPSFRYELFYRTIENPDWITASSRIETGNEKQREGQIITVKVDPGQTISNGWFVLGLERNQLVAEDFEDLARSGV